MAKKKDKDKNKTKSPEKKKKIIYPKQKTFRNDNTIVDNGLIRDTYDPYQQGWESGHAPDYEGDYVKPYDKNFIGRTIDKGRLIWNEKVPEEWKVLPGPGDIEDANYFRQQWYGPESTPGGKALSAAALALPVVGSKTMRKVASNPLTEDIYGRMFRKASKEGELARKWMADWYSSPTRRRKYLETYGTNMNAAEELDRINKTPIYDTPQIVSDNTAATYTSSIRKRGTGEINMYTKPDNMLERRSTGVHELTHALTNSELGMKPGIREELTKPFRNVADSHKHIMKEMSSANISYAPKRSSEIKRKIEYLLDPTEIYARANGIRHDLGLTPEDVFTEKHLERIMTSSTDANVPNLIRLIKNRPAFIKMMNTIPAIGAGAYVGSKAISEENKDKVKYNKEYQKGGSIENLPSLYDKKGAKKGRLHILAEAEKDKNDITLEEYNFVHNAVSDHLKGRGLSGSIVELSNNLYGSNPNSIEGEYFRRIRNEVDDIRQDLFKSIRERKSSRRDKTFIKNAELIKKHQKKYGDVTITPTYEESAKVDSVLKSMNPSDDLAIFGHSGSQMLGQSMSEVAEQIEELTPEETEVYMGTCDYGDEASDYSDIAKRTFHSTDDKSWWGPNTKGENFLNLMYGLGQDLSGRRLSPASPMDINKNKLYKKTEYQKGGDMNNLSLSRQRSGYIEGDPYDVMFEPTELGPDVSDQLVEMQAGGNIGNWAVANQDTIQQGFDSKGKGAGASLTGVPWGDVGNFAADTIDPFFTPDDTTGQDIDINEGASAAKGALKGAGTGAAVGSIVPGLGTLVGAGVGAVAGGLSNLFGASKKEDRLQEEAAEKQRLKIENRNRTSRLQNLQQPSYTPVAAKGGFITYKGQTHEGDKGGIPVDAQGNPTFITGSEPVARTEDKEVTWYTPEGDAYVFSEDLGFADKARKLVKKYKLEEKDINDPLLEEAVNKQFDNLRTSQELVREEDNSDMKRKGGTLTKEKAKKILEDGEINGKDLTPEQEKFFQAVAHGMTPNKQHGGEIDPATIYGEDGSNMAGDPIYDYIIPEPYLDSTTLSYNKHPLSSNIRRNLMSYGRVRTPFGVAEMSNYDQPYNMRGASAREIDRSYRPESNYNILDNRMVDNSLRSRRSRGRRYNIPRNIRRSVDDVPQNLERPVKEDIPNTIREEDDTARQDIPPSIRRPIEGHVPGTIGDGINYPDNTDEDWSMFPSSEGQPAPASDTTSSDPGYNSSFLEEGTIGYSFDELSPSNYTNLNPNLSQFSRQYLTGDRTYDDWIGEVESNPGGYTVINPETNKRVNLGDHPELMSSVTDRKAGRMHKSIQPAKMQGKTRTGLEDYKMSTQGLRRSPNSTYNPKFDINVSNEETSPDTSTVPNTDEEYDPMLSPLGHVLSGVGQVADYAALKGAEPEELSLARVGPERVSYARQRQANRQNANLARNINMRNARNTGLNAGQAMANMSAANTGVSRLLGQQNATSFEKEANKNALLRQQAGMTNAQIAMQEGLYNNRLKNAWKARLASQNPWSGLARTGAKYFADNAAYQRGWDIDQMYNPNMETYRKPGTTWVDQLLGKTRGTRFTGERLKYENLDTNEEED